MPSEVIAEHILITGGIHLFERLSHIKFLKCHLWEPNAEIRVSFSAILAIPDGGRLLLIRNHRRPEAFGPIGGVYKYREEARPALEAILFRPEDVATDSIMKGDLRGFLPRCNLGKLVKWFERKEDREMPGECLRREFHEELSEIGMENTRVPAQLVLRRIRIVSEGPENVPGQHYTQYRLFEVYALLPSGRQLEEFQRHLIAQAEKHKDLFLANTSEILVGRSDDGRMITHHSVYLIGKKRIRPEMPTFSRSSRV